MATTKDPSLICEIPNFANAYLGKVTHFQRYGLFRFGVLCNLLIWRRKTSLSPTINRVTRACDSTDQVVLQWSYAGGAQILHEGPKGGMCPVISAGKENNIFFNRRCKNLLFNFESILTLKGAGFSDLVRPGEGMESAFICNFVI